jgi:hypothetical protein
MSLVKDSRIDGSESPCMISHSLLVMSLSGVSIYSKLQPPRTAPTSLQYRDLGRLDSPESSAFLLLPALLQKLHVAVLLLFEPGKQALGLATNERSESLDGLCYYITDVDAR